VRERWLRGGMALAGLLVGIIYLHALVPILPLPARRDPTARGAGWEAVADRVRAAQASLDEPDHDPGSSGPGHGLRGVPGGRSWVGADRYQDVSELAYELFDGTFPDPVAQAPVFCVCLSGRRNQYDLWPGFPARARSGDALILLLDETSEPHGTVTRLAPYFTRVTRGELAPLLRGADTVSVRRLWLLEGYRGSWPSRDAP
jgi:hypothetical protein